jgi:hypothetical protein
MTVPRSGPLPLAARLVLAVALAAGLPAHVRAGASGHDRVAPPAPAEPPSGADRTELHLRFPPWVQTGTFQLVSASGALSDSGVARQEGDVVVGNTERVLEGARGTLVLRLSAGAKTPVFPPLFGRWEVVRGTGAYARLAGGGTFTSCGSGSSAKGSPFEVQTLVGHLHPRWVN